MSLKSPEVQSGMAGRFPKRIVIAGGGLTAWMAATLLQRVVGTLGSRITVIDFPIADEYLPAVATWPSILGLLQNLGVDENELLRNCHGTYRLATQFADWVRLERDFWLPLGSDRVRIDRRELFHSWFAERHRGRLLRPLHSYSLQWGASLAGKSPHAFSGNSPIAESSTYGLHLDITKLTDWLRNLAIRSNVEVVAGTIAGVSPNGRGGIAQIRLSSGVTLPGEFFIDCTGPSSLLAGDFLRDPLISWHERLLCDRYLNVRLNGSRQIPSFTKITGMNAGWMWQIPLAGHLDFGYVFSSQFASDQEAWTQLQTAVPAPMKPLLPEAIPPVQKFSSVRRTQFWRDNVLALGAAAVNLEPLAATGLHLSQTGIELFLEMFPDRSGNAASRDYYNEQMGRIADQVGDFVQLHYLLSQRREAPFWSAASHSKTSPRLQQQLDIYDISGALETLTPEAFQASDYYQLLSGCGRLPKHASILSQAVEPAHMQQQLREIIQQNEQVLRDLPLHEELLDWVHVMPMAMQEQL